MLGLNLVLPLQMPIRINMRSVVNLPSEMDSIYYLSGTATNAKHVMTSSQVSITHENITYMEAIVTYQILKTCQKITRRVG